MKMTGGYAICPGGVGSGRGDPLMRTILKAGGVGSGSGEPLAERMLKLGGVGSGDPLMLAMLRPGGVGSGSGEPLALSMPGGVGSGRGDPLRTAMEAVAARLLDKCLTELLTGSRIEIAKIQSAKRIEIFFFMVESLLRPTMKENRKY
jgi:hypothetical protein